MIKGKNLSNGFWVEAVNTMVYLKNRSLTRSLEFKTPFETLYGYKLAVKHLRIFGCKAFAQIPMEDRKKLDSKAIKCTFIGYYSSHSAYRLFNPSTHKIFVSRDVKFHEQDSEEIDEHYDGWDIPYFEEEDAKNNQDQQQTKEEDEKQQQREEIRFETSTPPLKRSSRKAQMPARYRKNDFITSMMNVVEPSSYKEENESNEWKIAMEQEYDSIIRNNTWEFVELPRGKQVIGCKWLYKPKINANGTQKN